MTLLTEVSLVGGLLLSLSIVYGSLRNYPNPGSLSLSSFMLAIAAWTLFHIGAHHGPAVAHPYFERLQWLGIAPLGALWLTFALDYSGHRAWVTRRILTLLFAFPVALFISIWVVPGVWRSLDAESGWLFSGYLGFTYGLVLVGSLLLLHHALVVERPFRDQIVAVLVGIGLIIAASTVSVLEVFGDLHIHAMPTGVAVSGLALFWAVFHSGLTDLTPVTPDAVLDAIPGGVVVVDTEDRVLSITDRAAELLGVEPSPERIGESVARLAARSPRLNSGEPLAHHTPGAEVETYAAEDRVIEVSTNPLDAGNGSPDRLVYLQDVTQRAEERRRLTRQNARLSQLAGVISHDLRNPLAVAAGRLDLAQAEVESEHLDEIEAAHDRIDSLIDDLLVMTRQGGEVADPQAVELADVVEACWRVVETADATIEVETTASLYADESRLRALLENLMRNAVEHGVAGVTVRVGDLSDGFFVEDDGPGIPESEREQVLESGYSPDSDGTGLGLAIVDEIVADHGWELAVTEGSMGGARFDVTGVTHA